MTPKARSRVTVAVALSLVAAASGCEIIANFDRSLIPGDLDGSASYDASPEDTGVLPQESGCICDADSGTDAGKPPGDSGGQDTSVQDSSAPDSSDGAAKDSTAPDAADTSPPADTGTDTGEDAGSEDASDDAG